MNTVVQYGTYRLTIKLPVGRTYAATANSTRYAMKLYINGELAVEAGHPAETKEETIPRTIQYTAFFTPKTETTEFVVQFANFNHVSGGGTNPVTIGKAETIAQMNVKAMFSTFIRTGCMLTIFLFYLGLFILYKRNSCFLTFALCCLLVGLAAFWSGGQTVALFLPNLSWFVSIAVEYLISILTLLFFTAFLCGVQPGLLNKWAVRAYYAYSGVYALLVLLTEPRFYTGLLLYFQIGVGLFFLHIFWRLLKNLRRRRLEEALLFAGVAVYLTTSILEASFNSFSNWLDIHFLSGISQSGMMAFVFINMMALALQFYRTEDELAISLTREQELSRENTTLDRMNKLKTEFLGNISHELKTPLAVMSSHAQLTRQHEEDKPQPDGYIVDKMLLTASEAERLAAMVNQLLDITRIDEDRMDWHIAETDIAAVIREAISTYYPLLNKNHNKIEIDLPATLPPVLCDPERVKQILLNLISNAIRFTRNGTITVNAQCTIHNSQSFITVSVSDTGYGIESDRLPYIFDRYYSKEANPNAASTGTGLGLYISKRLVEAQGGEIQIESEPGNGTAVTFTLPVQKHGQGESA